MSALPERRKSPEELAHLRAELGIPSIPAGPEGLPAAPPAADPGPPPPRATAAGMPPMPATGQQPAATSAAGQMPSRLPSAAVPPVDPPPAAPAGKPVRSLKRSERAPAPAGGPRAPRQGGKLPVQRHSDQELQQIRTRNALVVKPPVQRIAAQAGHPVLLGLGYLLALAGGAGGLVVAGWLFARKPRSHHHAALMTIIAVLVLAFGILYFLAKRDAA